MVKGARARASVTLGPLGPVGNTQSLTYAAVEVALSLSRRPPLPALGLDLDVSALT